MKDSFTLLARVADQAGTTGEAARLLSVSHVRTLQLVQAGRLRPVLITTLGRFFRRRDVERLKRTRETNAYVLRARQRSRRSFMRKRHHDERGGS